MPKRRDYSKRYYPNIKEMTDKEITDEISKINRGGYGPGNRRDLQDRFNELHREEKQRKEEARRRKANEAPIPSDEDAPYEEPVGLPEEVAQTKAPAGSQAPSKTKEKTKKGPSGEQLELDLKRSAQAAKLMKDAAQARRAIKGGKAGMDLLKVLRSGLTKGLALPIELLSIIAGPSMRVIEEEYKNKDKPKGT